MGVMPGTRALGDAARAGRPAAERAEARGRDVYVGEGCSYCHTQQVRPLEQDRVWGRPSTRGDYAYATPQLLGSERTGPDLTNIGARQPSAVWHLIHLYQPRALVHASIMPAYPWLFAAKEQRRARATSSSASRRRRAGRAKVVVATQSAQDLVAYLQVAQASAAAGRAAAVMTSTTGCSTERSARHDRRAGRRGRHALGVRAGVPHDAPAGRGRATTIPSTHPARGPLMHDLTGDTPVARIDLYLDDASEPFRSVVPPSDVRSTRRRSTTGRTCCAWKRATRPATSAAAGSRSSCRTVRASRLPVCARTNASVGACSSSSTRSAATSRSIRCAPSPAVRSRYGRG